ncbi:molybdopterin oxidoreductase [Aureimonas flava]|uniref:Molybdopterin oxidoreductase n=1 Tax=Aureimonas flava TaxID=2320271 RepID=A0A3A1WK63_9HYPH|nr:molybdopterin-dependent oxidoreductase [Aureimonas flava]RIY01540.1 molybdopterin oxidoreductase [Aureimonas flava]
MRGPLHRRRFLSGLAAASTLPLSGCFDPLVANDSQVRGVLASANDLTYRAQRLLLGSDDLAREFSPTEIRQPMRPNGSTNPQDEPYLALARQDFASYRLSITGAVQRPLSLSLVDLQAMPARSQITRHDCVEGWSCIAEWTGTPLGLVLDRAGVAPSARYVVFLCFDTLANGFAGPIRYYESIDLLDARHPQTILAYGMNGTALPVANGAPLRVRVERQLGYKMAKYVRAIVVTDSLVAYGEGKGGFWEDRGYDWFAGI